MSGEQVIRLLLELDQQVVDPRPSVFGKAAELVQLLCGHAECSLREGSMFYLGFYNDVDMSQIHKPAPRKLSQPILDEISRTQEGT